MTFSQSRFPPILRWIFSFVILFLLKHLCFSQDGTPKAISQFVEHSWDNTNGLPQATVLKLLQDRHGYVWIGTQEGLIRFDGQKMTLFDRTQNPHLKSDFIRSLIQTRDGAILAGGRLGLFEVRNGQIQTFSTKSNNPDDMVFALQEDDDKVWVGTSHGLYTLKNRQFTKTDLAGHLPKTGILSILKDHSNRLWLGTTAGLFCFKDNQPIPLPQGSRPQNHIQALFQASNGDIWVGSHQGAYRLRNQTWQGFSLADGLPGNNVLSFEECHKKILWIGTNRGLTRFKDDVFLDDPQKTTLNTVHDLLADSEGAIWVGTQSKGLKRLSPGVVTPIGAPEGLPPSSVRAIISDGDNGQWLGTRNGLVHWRHGKATVFNREAGLSSNDIKTVYLDSQNRLWVGTGFGGLILLKDQKVVKVYQKAQGLEGATVRTITEDEQGSIYVALSDGGVSIIKENTLKNLTMRDGLASNAAYTVKPTKHGLWIGYRGEGLDLIKDGVVTHFDQNDGLAGSSVFTIHETENGEIWVGTDSGLSFFNGKDFESILIQDGLYNGLAFSITEDDLGRFWMSCNKGVYSIEKKAIELFLQGKIKRVQSSVFDASTGMRNQECNFGGQASSFKDKQGKLWFPTISGLAIIDSNTALIPPKSPPMHLERIVANQKPFPEGLLPSILGSGIENLEVHYTALTFDLAQKVRFQYFLEGFDDQWVDAGNRRVAFYTNLPPGNFHFRLRIDVGNGIWHETIEPWSFEIRPYWFQRPWIWAAVVLAIIALCWQAFRLKEARHHANQAHLEHLVEKRTKALSATNQRLLETREALIAAARRTGQAEVTTNVLHNIGNALNSMNVTTTVLQQHMQRSKVELLARVVQLIHEHSHEPDFLRTEQGKKALYTLERLSEQFSSQNQRLEHEISNLERQVSHQNELIRAQQNVFDNTPNFREQIDLRFVIDEAINTLETESQGIDITRDYRITGTFHLEKTKLTQALLHLLSNGIFAVKANSEPPRMRVECSRRSPTALEIAISDNGIGIAKEHLARIFFNGFSQFEGKDGFGLHHCANIISEMGGRIWAESPGPGLGATFKIILPVYETRDAGLELN